MVSLRFLAALSASIAATVATYSIVGFQATDVRIPSEAHYIAFHVSQPDVPWLELGGNATSNCSISWTDNVPTCYTPCNATEAGGQYYTRVCPGSFQSAGQLAIEILETWFYEAPDAANASITFDYTDAGSGYWCSTGAQTKICFAKANVTLEGDSDGVSPYEEIDVCT